MPLSPGDRVTLTRPGRPQGTVKGKELDGGAYVALDSGASCTFPVAELELLQSETKVWPPPGIETK